MARFIFVGLLSCAALAAGCSKKEPPRDLAPVASSSLEAPKPASAGAVTLDVETPTSSVKFLMDSPLEKIDGDAPGSASGELAIDLADLSKSTGIIKVDLDKLTLYQQRRPEGAGQYTERKVNPKQNEHARDWLQLVPREGEVTPEQAATNRSAVFRIDSVAPSEKSVLALEGPERKVTATVSGPLRLHGREATKSAKLLLTFKFDGNKLVSLAVKTLEPFTVNLEKFEVNPRDSAGKFVKTVTDAIGGSLKGKLQSDAPLIIELSAKPR